MRRSSWIWSFLLSFLAILMLATVQQQEERKWRNLPLLRTSFSARPQGTKALYRTMKELGYQVERWRKAWRHLDLRKRNTVFLVIEPNESMVSDIMDWKRLVEFAQAGNVVWVSAEKRETVSGDELATKATKQVKVLYPAAWLNGVRRYLARSEIRLTKQWRPPVTATFINLEAHREIPLLGDDIGTVLKAVSIGEGFIIVDSNPYALSNEGVGKGDHFRLALNVVSSVVGRSGKVLFDEWGRGLGEGEHWVWAVTEGTRYAVWQLTVAGIVLMIAISIRFGKPVSVRSQPFAQTAFVHGLASLLQRGKALSESVGLLRLHFLRRVLKDPHLWRQPDEAEFQRRLQSLPPKERERVQQLWQWSEQLFHKRSLKEAEVLAWTKAVWQLSTDVSGKGKTPLQNRRHRHDADGFVGAR